MSESTHSRGMHSPSRSICLVDVYFLAFQDFCELCHVPVKSSLGKFAQILGNQFLRSHNQGAIQLVETPKGSNELTPTADFRRDEEPLLRRKSSSAGAAAPAAAAAAPPSSVWELPWLT